MSATPTVLIVGGGVAAGSTAASLREEGFEGDVVLVTSEPRPPHERPPLSKGLLAGDDDPSSTHLHPTSWWEARDVELRTGRTVVDLGTGAHEAVLDDGATIAWDRAVLATGASPEAPRIDGALQDGVHQLRTVDDALALRTALEAADRVAVVGASWIGTEVAAAARGHGCEVVLLASGPTPLSATLGPEVGRTYLDLHRDEGVDVRTDVRVARVTGDGRADGVVLEDGTSLDADLVVLGVGVTPSTGLATLSGIDVDDGVTTDASLRTSVPDVLAVGDVASHDHPRLGRLRVEHVEVARAHGVTAAKVLTGQDVAHEELPLFYSDQYDLGMEYVGHARDWDRVVLRPGDGRAHVAFYLDEDDVVLAGTHADVWDATDVIRALVGRTVDPDVLGDPDVALEDLAERAGA